MARVEAIIVALSLTAVAAVPRSSQRIVGGYVTSITEYPSIVGMMYSHNMNHYYQACGGTILNSRSVLTAAHCPIGDEYVRWRIRTGSSYAHSGGTVYIVDYYFIHPHYNRVTFDNDMAIMRTLHTIIFVPHTVQPALIAGSNYHLGDNEEVWAAGWGTTSSGGSPSEQLRHVKIWSVNQATCIHRYAAVGQTVTDNMLCSGYLDVGGRDQCQGDSGGPLYHRNVVVGVCSWGIGCALGRFPGVNARVSRFTPWIQAHA